MKAREIIAGWPRGRSCSPPYGQYEESFFHWRRVRCTEEEIGLWIEENQFIRRYRAEQQRMVDMWRRGVVEHKTLFKMMDLHEYEVPPATDNPAYYTYLLPRAAIATRPKVKMWVRSETPEQVKERLLLAASHALRSYQLGNASPELAKEVANAIDECIGNTAPKPETNHA